MTSEESEKQLQALADYTGVKVTIIRRLAEMSGDRTAFLNLFRF